MSSNQRRMTQQQADLAWKLGEFFRHDWTQIFCPSQTITAFDEESDLFDWDLEFCAFPHQHIVRGRQGEHEWLLFPKGYWAICLKNLEGASIISCQWGNHFEVLIGNQYQICQLTSGAWNFRASADVVTESLFTQADWQLQAKLMQLLGHPPEEVKIVLPSGTKMLAELLA